MSPEPVTMYLSSAEISQLSTEEDSFDCKQKNKCYYKEHRQMCIRQPLKTDNTIVDPIFDIRNVPIVFILKVKIYYQTYSSLQLMT